MRLVDYYHAVVFEKELCLDLFQENTIRHELKLGLCLAEVLGVVTDLVADLMAKLAPHLVRYPLGERDGSDSAWLRDADEQRGPALGRIVSELPGAGLRSLVDELRDMSTEIIEKIMDIKYRSMKLAPTTCIPDTPRLC